MKPAKAGIASLMSMAAVALCAPQATQAAQVNVTIQGIVQEGIDHTGVFGAAESSLAKEPFTLVFMIDSTKGTSLFSPLTGIPTSSWIIGTGTNNPMTGVLMIKGQTTDFGIGTLPISYISSKASRTVNGIPGVWFNINESNYANNAGGNGQIVITVSLPHLRSTDYKWQSPVYYTYPANGPANGGFGFDHWRTNSSNTTQTDRQTASGTLIVTSISIGPGLYSAAEKAVFAERGAFYYDLGNRMDMAGQLWGRLAPAAVKTFSESVVRKIFGDAAMQDDQIFAAQSLELSKGIVLELSLTSSAEPFAGGSIPEKYDVAAVGAMTNAVINFEKALDPPDWNYTTVEPAQPLSLPSTADATVDRVMADYLTVASYDAATLHAHERWQAATLAGDTASATRQLNAFNTYSALADSARAVLPADNLALRTALPPVNVNTVLGGTRAIAAAINALCGMPLPTPLNASLLSLGMSQTTINQRVCDVAEAVRPSDINTDFGQLLATPPP